MIYRFYRIWRVGYTDMVSYMLGRSLADLLGDDVSFIERSMGSLDVVLSLRSQVHWHVVAGAMAHIVLPRSDYLVLGVVEELVPVSHPACSPGNHE
jgi:hypothetical protein